MRLFTSVCVAADTADGINRAAIGAFRRTVFGHVQIDLGVGVPLFHTCQWGGAINAALTVEVCGFEFDGFLSHEWILPMRFVQWLQHHFDHRVSGECAV